LDAIANAIARRVKSRHVTLSDDPNEINDRLLEINKEGQKIGNKYDKWMPRSDESFYYYTFFEAHNILPFSGGLANQPVWLLRDWTAFMELTEYNELLAERDRLTKRLNK